MRSIGCNTNAFFTLVDAGLWERDVELRIFGTTDFSEIMRLAEEQSVVGLITAGLEHVIDVKVPQEWTLQFIGSTLQLEQRNKSMNEFVAKLISSLRKNDIYTLLVKGQGVAQCYERPLWRACGDVDLLLSKDNYIKAKAALIPLASSVENEDESRLHLGMNIDGWVVELHGTLLTRISNNLNKVVCDVQSSVFYGGEVRSWNNDKTQVFLPSANNDVFLVFSHFLEHFYVGGIGLRQLCDWCRLLWTFRDSINTRVLESRLKEAKIMSEWKGFAAFAVDYFGMPVEAMPFYVDSPKWHKRADKLGKLILEAGNFGHNKDKGYRQRRSKFCGLLITFWKRVVEYGRLVFIFPSSTPGIFVTYVFGRAKANL